MIVEHDIANGELRRFPGGQWAADCTCARWFGAARITRYDAAQDWKIHAQRAYARSAEKAVDAAIAKACAA